MQLSNKQTIWNFHRLIVRLSWGDNLTRKSKTSNWNNQKKYKKQTKKANRQKRKGGWLKDRWVGGSKGKREKQIWFPPLSLPPVIRSLLSRNIYLFCKLSGDKQISCYCTIPLCLQRHFFGGERYIGSQMLFWDWNFAAPQIPVKSRFLAWLIINLILTFSKM